MTDVFGRVRQNATKKIECSSLQELTGDAGHEKNSCQNENYLKGVKYAMTEI